VAAVARVPPARLQFMVAPEWEVLGEGGMDVPGLEGGWLVGLADQSTDHCSVPLHHFDHGRRDDRTERKAFFRYKMYLHSVVGRDDGIVGVYQGALAASDSDCRLQGAAPRTWSGSVGCNIHAADSVGCLVFILERGKRH
jgi:hypothetical protein